MPFRKLDRAMSVFDWLLEFSVARTKTHPHENRSITIGVECDVNCHDAVILLYNPERLFGK